jgi:hypothetical protein
VGSSYRVARTPGWAALAFPFLPPPDSEFDAHQAADTLATALKTFLSLHSHPELRLYLVDSSGRVSKFQALRDCAEADSRFSMLEGTLVDLDTRGHPARVIANPTNWQFHGKKGNSINRSINVAAGGDLETYCRKKFVSAAVGIAYGAPVEVTSALYAEHARFVIQISSPSMNSARPACLNGDYKVGVRQLGECYKHMFEMFFALTFPDDPTAAFVPSYSMPLQLPAPLQPRPSQTKSAEANAVDPAATAGTVSFALNAAAANSVLEVDAQGPTRGPHVDTSRPIAIAAFDMDATLIKNIKGGTWEWLYPDTDRVAQSLADAGFQVIIFTNQAPAGKGGWTAKLKSR